MTDPTLPDDLQRSLPDTLVLQRELGGGGMSRVYLARDNALGRDVVVKVLSPQLAGELSAERFTREIRMAATLQQANIVPLLTAGVAGDVPYFTMPFVDGQSLRYRLRDGARVGVSEAVDILRDVARALSYAHAHGIVHRDIKPENILLSHGAAVVTDFGIAKAVSASRTMDYAAAEDPSTLTRAGMSVGTPMYMAPEQITGSEQVDHRADIYAWGCVAYELLTGAPPFVREHISKVLTAHISEAPRALSEVAPSVPASLAKVVMQCLAKDAIDRPSRMQDVITALASTGEVSPLSSATRRSVPRAAVAAAVLVAAILGGVWWRSTGAAASGNSTPTATADASPSLAVIPFTSVGGDTANVYLAEGIADELTTVLSRIPGLRLAGRNSASRFRNGQSSPQDIGNALDVRNVLVGSVRRAGNRVRVTAELSSATDGSVVWQETFERDASDVFAVQEALATAIAGALRVQLAGGATTSQTFGTGNVAAYDKYLRGMQLLRARGDALVPAQQYFDEAIELDSTFARAYAAKSMALTIGLYYLRPHASEVLPRARALALKALEQAPDLADAHVAMALVHAESFEWEQAIAEGKRAVAFDSTSLEAQYRLGFVYYTMGLLREAEAQFAQVRVLDPLWGTGAVYLGHTRVLLGKRDDGLREARAALGLDASLAGIRTTFLTTLIDAGERREAGDSAARWVSQLDQPRRIGTVANALFLAGRITEARAELARIERYPENEWGRNASLFIAYAGAGDTASALAALDRAARGDGDLVLGYSQSSTRFDPVRSSARYRAALRRFHLEQAPVALPNGGRGATPH